MEERLAEAVAIMRQFLVLDSSFATTSSVVEEMRQVAAEMVNKFSSSCDTCDTYSCPVRREAQWVWQDIPIVSAGCVCVECGEEISRGVACVSVTCHHEGRMLEGVRCTFCHKVSLDYCSQLGHLRETVRKKTGMDYVSGEFDDE